MTHEREASCCRTHMLHWSASEKARACEACCSLPGAGQSPGSRRESGKAMVTGWGRHGVKRRGGTGRQCAASRETGRGCGSNRNGSEAGGVWCSSELHFQLNTLLATNGGRASVSFLHLHADVAPLDTSACSTEAREAAALTPGGAACGAALPAGRVPLQGPLPALGRGRVPPQLPLRLMPALEKVPR